MRSSSDSSTLRLLLLLQLDVSGSSEEDFCFLGLVAELDLVGEPIRFEGEVAFFLLLLPLLNELGIEGIRGRDGSRALGGVCCRFALRPFFGVPI